MERVKKENQPLYERLTETLKEAKNLIKIASDVSSEIDLLMIKLLYKFGGEIHPFREPIKLEECDIYTTYIISVHMDESGAINVLAWKDTHDFRFSIRWDTIKLEYKLKIFEGCLEEL